MTNPKNDYAQRFPRETDSLKTESSIDLDKYDQNILTGQKSIEDAFTLIKIDKSKPIQRKIVEIPFSSLRWMYQQIDIQKIPLGDYLASLRMHFGIKGDQLQLIFEPCCLKYFKNGSKPKSKIYKLHSTSSVYYSYNVNINCISAFDKEELTKAYESRISPFKTKSVIFPFQEMFGVHQYNHPSSEVNLLIYNAVVQDPQDSIIMRHSLLLAPINLTLAGDQKRNEVKFIRFLSFAAPGMYADLAHLCPPSCPEDGAAEYEYLME